MILDLSASGQLPSSHAILLNEVAEEIRLPFDHFVRRLSEPHKDNLDWWVNGPASRNTLVSPLFHYCCGLILLQKCLDQGESLSSIVVDTRAYRKVLITYLRSRGLSVPVVLSPRSMRARIKKLVWPSLVVFHSLLVALKLFICARMTRHGGPPLSEEPIVLIDTFLYGGVAEERHYPGIFDCLTNAEKKQVYFVPEFTKPRQFIGLFRALRQGGSVNFLLKQDFLRLADYWYAFCHLFRVRRMSIPVTHFVGQDMSPLVYEELRCVRGWQGTFEALLNYRFVRRLKEAGVNVRLAINWFENQVIDKGWNLGFRTYFPGIKTIGYQGFIVTPHYLCMYPTVAESAAGLLPQEVAVMGQGLKERIKEFFPDLTVRKAPAFRFSRLWNERNSPSELAPRTILVALPIMLDESVRILKTLDSVLGNSLPDSTRIWVKPHPDNTPEMVRKAAGSCWPADLYSFVTGDFSALLEQAGLLVSSASSSCMEALAKGVPVVVLGSQSSLTHNPIPHSVNAGIWKIVYSGEEVGEAIVRFLERPPGCGEHFMALGKEIRQSFFQPVSRDGVLEFLEFRQL